jgi:predicted  nucleic acid-binding Zn-ribbon protein
MANDNLVLEHLRHIRWRVDTLHEDMSDVKQRLTSLERSVARILGETAGLYSDQASQQATIDRLTDRIERIERRLELSD